jgi:Tfp pilus assembly protein PilP
MTRVRGRNMRKLVILLSRIGRLWRARSGSPTRRSQGKPAQGHLPKAPPQGRRRQPNHLRKPAAPAAAPNGSAEALAQRLAVLRRKVLREEDFAENDDSNRDPFRSYLDTWIERGPKITTSVVSAIFAKYSLEELTLIAVISGDANPRAMFRDPTGLGQTVKRGDYLSKSAARITKILSDRVVLEMSEITPGGATKALERAVLVNPEGTDQ